MILISVRPLIILGNVQETKQFYRLKSKLQNSKRGAATYVHHTRTKMTLSPLLQMPRNSDTSESMVFNASGLVVGMVFSVIELVAKSLIRIERQGMEGNWDLFERQRLPCFDFRVLKTTLHITYTPAASKCWVSVLPVASSNPYCRDPPTRMLFDFTRCMIWLAPTGFSLGILGLGLTATTWLYSPLGVWNNVWSNLDLWKCFRRRPPFLYIMTTATQPYSGLRRKLVLAFDVGTTFSGVSYRLIPFFFHRYVADTRIEAF